MPTIETERLVLRELVEEDAPVLYDYFSDKHVLAYYGMEPLQSLHEAKAMIENFHAMVEKKQGMRLAIVEKESGETIGTCGFHNYAPRHKRAEIGYELAPSHWGKGLATEAVEALIDHLFSAHQLSRIGAVVFIENVASRTLLQKMGFQEEGVLREYMVQSGVAHDVIMHAMLRSEWKKS
ncbi:GNAT family N-acetyltransferase [Priestia koreensis]|uniref:GNAT family N-acetyltransferase n=1 Tax=Priestia koreensis TaxID=284581 RepID=UPI00203D032E|nr:GNAT family protein [Priestia koreensis]MCM3004294.1 GNAT family N-acetyltransferase [Priestia koreensis]